MTKILEIPLSEITVSDGRARALDAGWAEGLAAIIAEQGLQSPVRVRRVDDGWHLVAGLHRLEAMRILGRETVPALVSDAETDDDARLEEVMENLGRYDLIALDRCQHLFELKEIYDRKHPDASKPGRRGNGKSLPISDEVEVFGFAKSISEQVGLSRRAINMAVRIWQGLHHSVRAQLRGTDLATKQTELKALSEMKVPQQLDVVALILDPAKPEIKNVAAALAFLERRHIPNIWEKRSIAIRKYFDAMDDGEFDGMIATHEIRIMESLKRRGRI